MALASTSVVPEADSDIERWRRKTLMLVIFVVGTAGPEEVDCGAALGAVADGVGSADTDAPEGSMDFKKKLGWFLYPGSTYLAALYPVTTFKGYSTKLGVFLTMKRVAFSLGHLSIRI